MGIGVQKACTQLHYVPYYVELPLTNFRIGLSWASGLQFRTRHSSTPVATTALDHHRTQVSMSLSNTPRRQLTAEAI
jgi:hypothetical protein